ncbi:hypothetical protein CBER1_05034 [Cercospora berteroae]|uniref:Uncharacterized protein n=1 Tax=Cercospora berteroae TaxID=357750 RepID=A0A2S6BRE1_9PEZI|nr:hypothetical protein CBER1_05034 [Cercospora berteroae]
MSGATAAGTPPPFFSMDDIEFLQCNVGFMNVETVISAIRDMHNGNSGSSLDNEDPARLLRVFNLEMWLATSFHQQKHAPTRPQALQDSSNIAGPPSAPVPPQHDPSNLVNQSVPGSTVPAPPAGLQQAQQSLSTDHQAFSLSSPTLDASSARSTSVSDLNTEGILASTTAVKPPKKRAPGHSTIRSAQRPNLGKAIHHRDMTVCDGKTLKEVFEPNNGIDTEDIFGAAALYVAVFVPHLTQVKDMVNKKRQEEGLTTEMMTSDKTFNKRVAPALKHIFGPENYEESKGWLKDARAGGERRQTFLQKLRDPATYAINPYATCANKACVNGRKRTTDAPETSSCSIVPPNPVLPGEATTLNAPNDGHHTYSSITAQTAASSTVPPTRTMGKKTRKRSAATEHDSDASKTKQRGGKRQKVVSDAGVQHAAFATPSDTGFFPVDRNIDETMGQYVQGWNATYETSEGIANGTRMSEPNLYHQDGADTHILWQTDGPGGNTARGHVFVEADLSSLAASGGQGGGGHLSQG